MDLEANSSPKKLKIKFGSVLVCVFFVLFLSDCVDQRCYEQADCIAPKICGPKGKCVFECITASDCATGFTCEGNICIPISSSPITCPNDMVAVADTFCIDRYEASRPDATKISAGIDDSLARSVAGVIPWQVVSNAVAEKACSASGKRLCTPEEWQLACSGPDRTAYSYGNTYQPAICNGLDTFGINYFHLMPTGSFQQCTNEWGVFDLNGNLWEHVAGGGDQTVRGGAYNCIDSAKLHRCDYVPGSWTPSARGFRCCLSSSPTNDRGDSSDSGFKDSNSSNTTSDTGGGCINEDIKRILDVNIDANTGTNRDAGANNGDMRTADADANVSAGCPSNMVVIGEKFCIDVYEASRADATASYGGISSVASARAGVIPWFPVTLAEARAGCESMGKRLCRPNEWFEACQGPAMSIYAYGNSYDPVICNGLDSFCDCSSSACAGLTNCPYPHCYNQPSTTESGGPCGGNFHVMPTGSFPACTNAYGVFDVNGNVWEIVDTSDDLEHYRGGAYNCSDSELFQRCDYDATWNPSAKGFRCCKDWKMP